MSTATLTHPSKAKAAAVRAAAKKQPLAVYGPNLEGGHTFHVMAQTDRKGKTKMYSGEPPMLVEATSIQQMVEFVYADQMAENGNAWTDYQSEFKILPSAAKLLDIEPAPKPKATSKPGKTPTKTFPDSTGRDIKKGDRVKLDGKVIGTCAYRVMDGKRHIPRIGVELASTGAGKAAGTIRGRSLKRRCFDAADLTIASK